MRNYTRLMLLLGIICSPSFGEITVSREFMDNLEYIGVVLDSPGYMTWGTSVVQGADGNFHMYACQWPVKFGFRGGWHKESMVSGTIFDYWGRSKEEKKELMAKEPFTRHESGKFERPAFLFQNGKPTYFYAVGDVNIHGGKTPEVYVLRIKDSDIKPKQ